ncbi:MAG: DinB family protein [Candidatus Latescibacterota bacterium]|nr:MAG: DinB family protein [Candidatus Latescibacterota bacterium]
MLDCLGQVLVRDLHALSNEIRGYPADAEIWGTAPGISNSPGNLALHVCGNLQHYIGAHLGSTGYVRDRQAEFGLGDVPRTELLRRIDATIAVVEEVLPRATEAQLAADFPEKVAGVTVNTADFLLHLATHLGYHLGQIDYHRRLTTAQNDPLQNVSVAALKSARADAAS